MTCEGFISTINNFTRMLADLKSCIDQLVVKPDLYNYLAIIETKITDHFLVIDSVVFPKRVMNPTETILNAEK